MPKRVLHKSNAELLAMYDVVQRNIDNFKSDNRTYLVYYSAISAAILELHGKGFDVSANIITWLHGAGAAICCSLISYNYWNGIINRRRILGRTIGKFPKNFWRCNFDDDDFDKLRNLDINSQRQKIYEIVTDPRPFDLIVYCVQFAYSPIIFWVTWFFISPNGWPGLLYNVIVDFWTSLSCSIG
jgi:hypothetical protein